MLKRTGIACSEDIERARPDETRRKQGPVAWIECFREIPCDPCHDACRVGAIEEFSDINDLPCIDHEACTGCGLCVAACPGLAIFVIDETHSETQALLALPHEFTPLPDAGDEVVLMTRSGQEAGYGRVHRVQAPRAFDRTAVIWVIIPQDLVEQVRAIKPLHQVIDEEGGEKQ